MTNQSHGFEVQKLSQGTQTNANQHGNCTLETMCKLCTTELLLKRYPWLM